MDDEQCETYTPTVACFKDAVSGVRKKWDKRGYVQGLHVGTTSK